MSFYGFFGSSKETISSLGLSLFSNRLKEQTRLKICENLRTASLNPKFNSSYKKKVYKMQIIIKSSQKALLARANNPKNRSAFTT